MVDIFKKKNFLNLFFLLFLFAYFEIVGTTFKILNIDFFTFMYFSIDLKFVFFAFCFLFTFFLSQKNKFLFLIKIIKDFIKIDKIEKLIFLVIISWLVIDLYHFSYSGEIDIKHEVQLIIILLLIKFFEFIKKNSYQEESKIVLVIKIILFLNLCYSFFYYYLEYFEKAEYFKSILENHINWSALLVPHNFTDMSHLAFIYLFLFFNKNISKRLITLLYLILLLHAFTRISDFAVMQFLLVTFMFIFFGNFKLKLINKILIFLSIFFIIFFQKNFHLKVDQIIWMTKKSDENIINIINETHNFDRKYHNIKVGLYKVEEKYEDSYYRGHALRYLASVSSLKSLKENIFFGKGTYDLNRRSRNHFNVEDENYFTRILSSYGLLGGLFLPLFVVVRVYFLISKKLKKIYFLFISFLIFSLPSEGYFHHSNSIFFGKISNK